MSTDTTPSLAPDSLTREQLLDALDNEIAKVSAAQTAAGWNQWAILGAIAALLWLFIDIWEKGRFDIQNVLFLILAFSLTWDVIRQSISRFDSPPIKASDSKSRFYSLNSLLATARTSIFFVFLKYATFFLITALLKTNFLWPTKFYTGIMALICLLAVVISLWDNFPEQPSKPNKILLRIQRIIQITMCVLEYSSVMFVWGFWWLIHNKTQPLMSVSR